MTNDELRALAEAALTEDDWGYAYDDYTDASTPERVIALLDEIRELRAALRGIASGGTNITNVQKRRLNR